MKRKKAVYLKKEFRVMTVKMIQNIGSKMETQINRLEAQIQKI